MYYNTYYLINLLIGIAVGYYLYTDANKRGRNGLIWGILGFLFSVVTLIIYLIMKESDNGRKM